MLLKKLMAISLLVGVVGANAFAAEPKAVDIPIEIVSAEFGIFDEGAPNELVFTPANVVPHRQGQRYGWVIEVRTGKRTLSVREEYLLAETPKTPAARTNKDTVGETLNIPLQRRNQVSQRQLAPVDGRIYGEWSIGPNEPAGHRHLQVVIEGQPAASFEYDVK